jgi:hypothetical protein
MLVYLDPDCRAKMLACHVIEQAHRDYMALRSAGSISRDGKVVKKSSMDRTCLCGDTRKSLGTQGLARELVDFFHARGGGLELWVASANLQISPQTVRDALLRGAPKRREGFDDSESVWQFQIGQVL